MSGGDVRWSLKLPTLVIGLILGVVSLGLGVRGRLVTAIIVMTLAVGFTAYSLTIKDWCESKAAWSAATWGEHSFGQCFKLKGWWSF